MPEILEAIQRNGLALVALVVVSGFLYVVLKAFYKELSDRRVRAENLTDTLIGSFDDATAVARAALDELRKR
jgi:hypothetical protein